MSVTPTPSLRTKLVFWLLLGFLSVALAEVVSGSSPLAFVNPFETIFLTLFYGTHLLVFAWLSFRRGWPTLTALWLGGVLFGLYEFYITKVMWAPPWGETVSLAHVDLFSLIVLAFFWHPFMAFIFPLALGERYGTTSQWVSSQLPAWFTGATRRTVLLAFGIVALSFGSLLGSPAVVFAATVSAVGVVVLTGHRWRRTGRNCAWDLRELLPTDPQGKRLLLLLGAQYALFAPTWNVESIPPLLGHVVVWLLYAGFALLFSSALRHSQTETPNQQKPAPAWPRRRAIKWAGAFLLFSALGSLGQPEIGALVVWIGSSVAGSWMLIVTLRRSLGLRRGRQPVAHVDDQVHTS